MRHLSQEKLRGLCLVLLVFGALSCGDEPAAPVKQAGQAPATVLPDWAEHLCDLWRAGDGSCDQTALIADFEECQRTQGVPELERLRSAGVRTRMRLRGMERMTNLCLEKRFWVMTPEGRATQLGQTTKPSPSS